MASNITDPQIIANFSDSIETVLDNFNLGSVKREYIRATILGRLEYEWKFNSRLNTELPLITDPDEQKRVIFNIVAEVAKKEIEAETRNLQVEAEKKIISEAVKGNYFKKGGFKKATADISDWFGPFGRSVRKLSGLKKDADPDVLRDTILDVVFPETQKGLQGVQNLLGQYAPEEDIGLKDSLIDTALDVALGKTVTTKPRSLGFDSINGIKVAYDKSLQSLDERLRRRDIDRPAYLEELAKLKESTKAKLEIVRDVNDHVIEENRRNISGQFFDTRRAKFVGIAEATSFERKEGPPRFSVFSYEFDDVSHSLRIVDEVEDFYQEGVGQFLNVSPLTFVSKNRDQLKHTEALTVLRELEIQGFRDFNFQSQGTDFYNQVEKNYTRFKTLASDPNATPEVIAYFNQLEEAYKRVQEIRENAPNINASQVFSDVEEFKSLVSRANNLSPAEQSRLTSLQQTIKRYTNENSIDISSFSQNERNAFIAGLDSLDATNPATIQAVSISTIEKGALRRFGGASGNDFVALDTFIRELPTARTSYNSLTPEERARFDSLKAKIDTHLASPAYAGVAANFNAVYATGDLSSISNTLNTDLITTRYSNRSSHHRLNIGFSTKDALNLHLGDLESLLTIGPGITSSFPNLKAPFVDLDNLLTVANSGNQTNFVAAKNNFYNKYVFNSRVFSLSSTLEDSLKSATTITEFNRILPQLKSEILSQYVGAPATDLFSLKAFMDRLGVADFNALTPAQKIEFTGLKNKVLSHLENGHIAFQGISAREISQLRSILENPNPNFGNFASVVTPAFKDRFFNGVIQRPELFFKSKFKEIPGFTNDLSSLMDILYLSSDFSGLTAEKKAELEKLVTKLKDQLNKLDASGKYPLLNIDSDFKSNLLASFDNIRTGNFDALKLQMIELQSLSLFDQALQSREELFKKLANNKDYQEILKKQRALSNALSVVNSMQSLKRLNAEQLALLDEYKRQLIRDLDLFGFTPAEIAEIRTALNSNNYAVIKKYFSSGIFGNKKIDLFQDQLNKDLLKLANSVGDKKFSNAITRRILNNQITQAFIGRKMFEQLITGAQMATDYKFLKQEVKRTLQTLVLNNVSGRWKAFLDSRVSNSAARNFIDNVVSLLREADKQKNPAKFFWQKFRREVVDTFVASFIKRRLERFLWIKINKKRYALDPTQLITNPINYISTFAKDIFFREAKNLIYRKIILRYFRKNKFVLLYKLFSKKAATFRASLNNVMDNFMANPFKFTGEYAVKGIRYLGGVFTRYFPALTARAAAFFGRFAFFRALSLTALTNPIGWAVMVVVFVGPILLKPFFGDIDYFKSLVRMLLFCCLLPFIFIFTIIFVPILVLVNFGGYLWDAVAQAIGTVLNWDISEVLNNDSNWSNLGEPYRNTIDYRAAPFGGDFYLGGFSGGLGGNAYLANLGSQNTSWGSHCFIGNHTSQKLLQPSYNQWMNLDIKNNELLKEADNDVSFSILCSASYHLSQVFPGFPSAGNPPEKGTISCHAGQPKFFDRRGGFTDRYWCTRIVVDSYQHLYQSTKDDSYDPGRIRGYYSDLVSKTRDKKFVEVKIEYDSSGFSKQCLPIEYLNSMSGAITLFNYGDHTACDVNVMLSAGEQGRGAGAVSHVGLFYKINQNGLQFVQTNAGFILDEAPSSKQPCTATVNGQSQVGIRITRWFTNTINLDTNNDGEVDKVINKGQYLCGMYFPIPSQTSVLGVMQSAPALVNEPKPHKNLAGDRICPIPVQNNFNHYQRTP